MNKKYAKANVNPIRQRTQFSCVATSTCMALNALGVKCTEDQVNEVIGAAPLRGARWEEVLACCQYFGCRATLTTPATLTQVKAWTDAGKPVLMAWNPEGREWSHASLIFDVTGKKGSYEVHIADPNIPNPDKTVRVVGEDEFYGKWFEKLSNYLVRRPALMIEREVDEGGRQIMASKRMPLRDKIALLLNKDEWVLAKPRDYSPQQQESIWTLYDTAYREIGKHIGSKAELLNKYALIEATDVDTDPEIDVFIAFKVTPFGRKIAIMGHDGTKVAKRELIKRLIVLAQTPGYYLEGSDRIAEVLVSAGIQPIQDKEKVYGVLGDMVEEDGVIWEGDGWYSRELGSLGRHKKAIFGKPLVRLRAEREVDEEGREIMASVSRPSKKASLNLPKNTWTFVSAADLAETQKQEIWSLFERTYGAIGMHMSSPEELFSKCPHLVVLDNDEDPNINAFIALSRTPFGYKLNALGHDGTSPSKRAIISKHQDLLTTRGYFAALSEDMERVMRRSGLDNVKDSHVLRAIFGDKIQLVGDGYYMKDVDGVGLKRKAIFGLPVIS